MQQTTIKTSSKLGLILLAYVAFISLGLPDGLLGVAWPSIRSSFGLPLDALGMLMIAGMAGYMTSSFLSGKIMARLGVGGVLAASCALTGSALLGYTLAPAWWVMVGLGVVAGLGAGAIDAGINTYVASNFSPGLMQWLHASFGVGVTLGPLIMTTGLNLFSAWRWGYVVVGVGQLVLAAAFFLTISLWQQPGGEQKPEEERLLTDYATPLRQTMRQPGAWLSILLFFTYTGTEICLGVWAYSLLTESRGIDPAVAGFWAGSYWASFTVGRVLAGLYSRRVSTRTLLTGSMLLALAGALLLWWNPNGIVSLVGVVLTGFAVAPIFPALVTGTSARVGPRHAANTIGMQIAGAGLGGSVIPGLAGVLAARFSLEVIPAFLTVLIVFLLGLHLVSSRGKDLVESPAF